jgi:hypothetical protein
MTCSAKVRTAQSLLSQKNRRIRNRISTLRPATAASASRRSYRLCTRADSPPQPEQHPCTTRGCAQIRPTRRPSRPSRSPHLPGAAGEPERYSDHHTADHDHSGTVKNPVTTRPAGQVDHEKWARSSFRLPLTSPAVLGCDVPVSDMATPYFGGSNPFPAVGSCAHWDIRRPVQSRDHSNRPQSSPQVIRPRLVQQTTHPSCNPKSNSTCHPASPRTTPAECRLSSRLSARALSSHA